MTNTLTEPAETVQILLSEAETRFVREFLERETADPESEEVPLVKTAVFQTVPGLEADIKACNGDSPYVDPVLFREGNEVECLGVEDTFEGVYDFIYEGKLYRVDIVGAELPEKTITDLGSEHALPWKRGHSGPGDAFRLVSASGNKIADIQGETHTEIGGFVLKAANSHDKLVAALGWIAGHDAEFGEIEDPETMVANMTQKAKEALENL